MVEPEGSLPHSQASATCPYPGPAQSSPHTHIPPPEVWYALLLLKQSATLYNGCGPTDPMKQPRG